MEDGLFPGMQSITGGEGELEEERRLAYIAITRAKDQLYISHVKDRLLYGRTSQNPVSRFVKEIPEKLIEQDLPYISRTQYTPRSYIENSQVKPKTLPKGDLTLKEGDRVYHLTFKEGEIMSVTPMGADVLYEVTFDNFGTKKLMGTFARLKKIN
jgi:DNA helicase-2/ATP-dependent DNA helicase PcrA